jgi:hypothetical protein
MIFNDAVREVESGTGASFTKGAVTTLDYAGIDGAKYILKEIESSGEYPETQEDLKSIISDIVGDIDDYILSNEIGNVESEVIRHELNVIIRKLEQRFETEINSEIREYINQVVGSGVRAVAYEASAKTELEGPVDVHIVDEASISIFGRPILAKEW